MRTRYLVVAVVLMAVGSLLLAQIAGAQTVNPTLVVFDHVDFATAAHYEGGYFLLPVTATNTCDLLAVPAASPAMTDNLGKPTTTTGVGMTTALVARPIGCYVYKVRALDLSGLYSDWSGASDPFVKRPAAVSKPVVR